MNENISIPLSANGKMREFGNGCHRDDATGKGRCDWLPLHEVAHIMNDEFIEHIAKFMDDHKVLHLENALRMLPGHIKEYTSIPQMMIEVSKLYESGAVKYGTNNWQRGMPLWCYIDSGLRHYFKTLRGDKDEPHHRGIVWNLLCAIWTVDNIPDSIKELHETRTDKIKVSNPGDGRCDLLPLNQVACLMDDNEVLDDIAGFIKHKDIKNIYSAFQEIIVDDNPADVMLSLAKIYEIQGKDENFGVKGWENLPLEEALHQALMNFFTAIDSGKDHLETLWWLLNVAWIANNNPDELEKLGEKE